MGAVAGPEAVAARFAAARGDASLVVLEGFHALKHALRFGAEIVEAVTDDPVRVAALAAELAPDLVGAIADRVLPVGPETFAALASPPPRTGVVAIARRPLVDPRALLGSPGPAPVVFLDRPAHLGNLGAVVRVAAAAGAAGVLSSGPHDPWHPSAIRGSAGLHFAVPVAHAQDPAGSDRPLVAVDPSGTPVGPGDLPSRAVLAFGSERGGLAPELLDRAAMCVGIPMKAGVSSLNLATAVAVVLYTWRAGHGA